jgi:hypothetical protein
MGLDVGIGPFACGLFEWRDRLARTFLHQQGDAQEMQRGGVPGIPRQSVASEALGLGRTLLLERSCATLENIVDRCPRPVAAP